MNPATDKPIYFFLEDLDYHIYRLDGHANQPFIVGGQKYKCWWKETDY